MLNVNHNHPLRINFNQIISFDSSPQQNQSDLPLRHRVRTVTLIVSYIKTDINNSNKL